MRTTSSQPEAAKPPELSACRQALTESIAIAPSIPPIKGPGGCGGEDLVRLEAVVLSPTQRVAVKPAAILRCPMAAAIADWIRVDIASLAASVSAPRSANSTTSIHFHAVAAIASRGQALRAWPGERTRCAWAEIRQWHHAVAHRPCNAPRETREKVLASVCARSPPCWAQARTGITRITSISTSPNGATTTNCASGVSTIRCRRLRP